MASINKSYSKNTELVKTSLFGIGVTNDVKENILEFIVNSVKKNEKPYYVVTPNPEMIVLSTKNSAFRTALNNAKIATNDGVGLSIAARVLGKDLKERFTGVELMKKLCEKASHWPITVGFLGGGPKIAENAAECLRERFPGLRVVFARHEWDEKKEQKIDILFVAFGAPKQELWMTEHVGKLPIKVMIGVGGAFDQIVHVSLMPPQLIQNIGLGWLYRLIRQPWRLKRQLALGTFIGMVIKEKFRQDN